LGVDKERADLRGTLKRLLDAGINVHAQVVLCPRINDGDVLLKTINDLAAEYPRITSVAIVPLGLTRYNTDARLTPVTPDFCREVIHQVETLQTQLRTRLGTNFAFLGDEIYLRGGRAVPPRAHYGEYPQIEDGVGMVRSFHEEFGRMIKRLERKRVGQLHSAGTILTGTLFAPVLQRLIDKLNARFRTMLSVVAVSNGYFGGDVSVAGLLTGRDLLTASERISGDFVLIPKQVLKSDEAIMLDGMRIEEVEQKLGVPVQAIDVSDLTSLLLSANTN
jgi:putative radical SAM enzyme (TIGR03279 family)